MSDPPPVALSPSSSSPAVAPGASVGAPTQPPPVDRPYLTSPLRGGNLSSTNRFAYNIKTGTELGPGLVDETGMGGRLHQMAPAAFLDTVPGPQPTADQRLQFIKPVIDKDVISERKLAPIFTKSMKSVLEVAATNTLRVVDTASHKAADGHDKPTDTLNDIGFYLDTPVSRSATDLTPERRKRSRIPPSEQYARELGRRSWHWIVVPVELKWSAPSAFYAENSTSKTAKVKKGADGQGDAKEATSMDAGSNGGAGEEAFIGLEGSPISPSSRSSQPSSAPPERPVNSLSSPAPSAPESASRLFSAAPVADPVQGKQFIRDTPQGEIALGQFAGYQLNIFTHQHRCFLYGIYVRRKGARMIYCDRTGARVSEEFDWTSNDSFLHTFVWKLAHMSPEQLGFDPTAELATDAECAEIQTARGDDTLLPHVVEAVNNSFDGRYPVYKLRITIGEPFPDEAFPPQDPITRSATPPEQTTKEQYFLVARPHFHTDALVGRCTKCYIAYDLEGRRFCFLKDYWRPLVTNRARPEHLVYNRLHSARTPFIATLICGGDVGGPRSQKTQVQDNLPSKNRPVPRVHYRIAIAEIGQPLKTFIGFRHLANIFAQVITAHDHAVKCAGVLHRDISVGNIMINTNGDGFLIDWDLSRLISELGTGPIEPERTGTWQFQSALFLRWPRKPYRASDDIESFIHAFRYMVLRYHVTKTSNLYEVVGSYFDAFGSVSVVFSNGTRSVKLGGDAKFAQFGSPRSSFTVKGNPKLQTLLDDIACRCYESYATVDEALMDSVYGLPEVPGNQQEEQNPPPPPAQSLDNVSWVTRSRRSRRPPAVSLSPIISTPPADPCDISGFLADAQDVIDTFAEYIESISSQADKAADVRSKAQDEFKRRESERPKIDILVQPSLRHISALSTSYTPTSVGSAEALAPAAPDTRRSGSPGSPSPMPSRDLSLHPSAPLSRATSPGPSVAPSSNESSPASSPLPGVPPVAGPSSACEVPAETLGKRRGRTSDVAEAVSARIASGAADASRALPKPPPKKARN